MVKRAGVTEMMDISSGSPVRVFKYDPQKAVRVRERPRLTLNTGPDSPVKQEFKEECDINVLMKRYQKTGLFPQFPGQQPRYISNIGMPDYQESLHIVMAAQEEFAALNSELRKRFDNDPAKFLEFCNDPSNGDELIKLGLREAPAPEPGPVRVEVVNQAPAGDQAPD